ncbi:hypothetical protein [Flavobacterium sp. N1736]|uniref:hypothetical protein n=1 Tax=Flavobacterium sp. N1736 TaxID=2986823 RepID=UPI0022241E25|nr:hypothetical protein [Flavobacterium sp. N1736]
MKRNFFILAFIFFVMQNIFAQKSRTYKVLAIDSVSNYYFITFKKNFKKHLIVSVKSKIKDDTCEKIMLFKKYDLILFKYVPVISIPNRKNFSISIEDRVVWSDGGKYTAYTTDMLLGLCFK